MSKPSVLIATPAYGGLVTVDYMTSLLSTILHFAQEGIQAQIYTLKNESLIPRGRNQCAWYALTHGPEGKPFDKLLFIDADMGWTTKDVDRLLESDKKLIGGCYPVKSYPIELACNALPEHYPIFGEKRSVENLHKLRDLYGNERGEVKMMHIPTGFMLIDTSLLTGLIPHVRSYIGTDWNVRQKVRMWDFFPSGPHEERDENGDAAYESEDWAFCSLIRKHLGEDVWLNTNVITKHQGTHTFRAGNF